MELRQLRANSSESMYSSYLLVSLSLQLLLIHPSPPPTPLLHRPETLPPLSVLIIQVTLTRANHGSSHRAQARENDIADEAAARGADPGVAVETAGAGFEPGLFVMPAMMMVMLGVGVVAED